MFWLKDFVCLLPIYFAILTNQVNTQSSDEKPVKSVDQYHLPAKQPYPHYPSPLSEWTSWTSCNRKCIRRRIRYCLEAEFCPSKVIKQRKRCNQRGTRCSFSPRKIRKDKAKQMEETVYELLYGEWSQWSSCTRSCKKRRYRSCLNKKVCRGTVLMEHRACYAPHSKCRTLLQKKHKKTNEEKKKKNESSSKNSRKDFSDRKHSNSSSNNSSNKLHVKGCGIRNVTATTRIIGGQESRQGSWPWQVAILTQWKEQYCGGVLITPQWVLTAAHCLRRRARMRKVILRIGEHDFDVKDGDEQDFRINKQAAIIHPQFSMKDIDSDIALVQLKEPIKNENSVGYACLPETDDILPEKTLCYVVGWGKEKETHLYGTDILQEVAVPLVNEQKCQDAFDFKITSNQMCAGYRKGGRDTCAGDSGGPLMCEITKQGVKRWYVYGVTSFGEGCGDKGKYGIYTNVKNFNRWIKNIISNS